MLIRIATRASPLARWQANHVAALIRTVRPDAEVVVEPLSTEGDRRTDVPLSEIGGKGVFATEVQAAVFDGRCDVAVHSGKDLPALTPDGLVIAAVPERGDVRDALVGCRLIDLPADGVVATGSARRRVQLAHLRPDLRFQELRGNMATRLSRAADVDAIVVAAVALERLGLAHQLTDVLPATLMIPQVAQGALIVECRSGDVELLALLAAEGAIVSHVTLPKLTEFAAVNRTVLYASPRQGDTKTTERSLRISDVARKLLIVTRSSWGL
mgnify:CR=1 FL=1